MNDPEHDPHVLATTRRIAELAGRVDVNPQHQARLREELLRRHQELSAENTQRSAGTLWPRLSRLKRLTLVAPTALAAAISCSVLFWALQISLHQSPQAAEAARLSRVLVLTVPTVTHWTVQVRLHQLRDNEASVQNCSVQLKPGERVYVAHERAYFYSYGKWYQVTPASAKCLPDWQWAFAELAARLANGHQPLSIVPARPLGGQPTERISYTLTGGNQTQTAVAALVDRRSGLIRRLERVTRQGGKVIEQDSADYAYETEK